MHPQKLQRLSEKFMKRRKVKNKFIRELKFFIIAFLATFVLLGIICAIFLVFSQNHNILLNPLSNKKDVFQNQAEDLLEKTGINFSSVKIASDSSYLVTLQDGSQVILNQNKNLQNQISSLQLILSRLTIEGKRFKSLDFRYDKPVVSF